VVAESFAGRLTAFDRAPSGDLSNRRTYAELAGLVPDGMCLDQAGNIWVAAFAGGQFLQVDPHGQVIGKVDVRPDAAVACQLGGTDGRTLYCLVYAGAIEDIARETPGARIDAVRVDSPAAGSP
jgi:sugar lactone lactonase YvrE